MLNKVNIKHIIILALGFFWCSSVYLTQEQYLSQYANVNFVNIVELLFGSLAMALGILLFSFIYKHSKRIELYYGLFTILSVIFIIAFFGTKNIYLMSIFMILTCLFGTAGFGAGYHFSLLGNNVSKAYRGRVFAIGYGLGSIGTFLMILLPESFYSSIQALIIYMPAIFICLYLVLQHTKLDRYIKDNYSKSLKMNIIKLSIVVLFMSLLSALATDVIAVNTIDIPGGYGGTRIYYCLGLLIAGYLSDKYKDLFGVLTIVSFIFSLLAIVLFTNNYSINIIAALSYFFIGFFVLFRTINFVNLVNKKRSLLFLSAYGLMYSRIMEGIMVLFEDYLIANNLLLLIVNVIILSIVIIIFFFMYFKKSESKVNVIDEIIVKYGLSRQEDKVLRLLIQKKSNKEIADELYISLFTVKRHIANIYKKTSMNKKELLEKYYLGL